MFSISSSDYFFKGGCSGCHWLYSWYELHTKRFPPQYVQWILSVAPQVLQLCSSAWCWQWWAGPLLYKGSYCCQLCHLYTPEQEQALFQTAKQRGVRAKPLQWKGQTVTSSSALLTAETVNSHTQHFVKCSFMCQQRIDPCSHTNSVFIY